MSSKWDTERFVSVAENVHGDRYDYSKSVYLSPSEKITITCREHGDFQRIPRTHLQGAGCPLCPRITTDEFIRRFRKVHQDKFIYDLFEYVDYSTPATIICREHGSFQQLPKDHLKSAICCPECIGKPRGFDSSKPSKFYIYVFRKYIGFGITNNLENRHSQHLHTFKKAGIRGKLLTTYDLQGELALALETYVKRNMPITNTGIDGFRTEAVHKDELPNLLSVIDNYINNIH